MGINESVDSVTSARVWTPEELASVWPVKGWEWTEQLPGHWYLVETATMVAAWVAPGGLMRSTSRDIPVDVAAALVGAHQGRDSVEAMVRHLLDESAANERSRKTSHGPAFYYSDGAADALADAAAMLRTGRVPE